MMGKGLVLGLDAIEFSFLDKIRGETKVLDGITANFFEYEIVALVGPSGCGKSTLLNVISGLLNPVSGEKKFARNDVGLGVGYVFQQPSLLPWMNVLDNALLGAEIAGRSGQEIKARARELFRSYGIAGFEDSYPAALSGGMQQRIALVRAILADSSVLLLDEPFSDSDYSMRWNLQTDLSRAVEEEGLTAILVTHDLEEAVKVADRVLVFTQRPTTIKKEVRIPIPRSERLKTKWGLPHELTPYLEALWQVLD